MARRRRRNPINQADYMPIVVGAIGGGLAMYLYLKSATSASPSQTVSLTSPALPTLTTPGQTS